MSRRPFASPPPAAAPRKRRGLPFGKFLIVGLLGLGALAWFAPTIAMQSPFRERWIQAATKDFPGKIAISSASAGWMSPVRIGPASVFDAQGQEILKVAQVRTEKTLFALLMDPRDVGLVRIEQPHLKLSLRPDGSNLEDLLEPFLNSDEPSSPVGFALEVVDGVVEVQQAVTPGAWRLDALNATVKLPYDRSSLLAQVKSAIQSDHGPPGSVQAEMQWQFAAASSPAAPASAPPSALPPATFPAPSATPAMGGPGQGIVNLQSTGLPLEIVTLGLRRAGLDVQLSGVVTADASATISAQNQSIQLKQCAAQNLFVASPTWLGTDRLQLAQFAAAGEFAHTPDQWMVRNGTVRTDVGTVDLSGNGASNPAAPWSADVVEAFRHGNWNLRSQLDLAKLATMLPATLRLREGTHISAGQITASLVSQTQPAGSTWNADMQASGLAAMHAGSGYEWKKPVVIKAAVRETPQGIAVDQLTCDSSFLQLRGKGTLAQGDLSVQGDLSQFVAEFGRFVDLGSMRAAGSVTGQMDWRAGADQTLAITGKTTARDFELTYSADRPWQEPQLEINFSAEGTLAENTVQSIRKAQIEVFAAGDRLESKLLEPVSPVSLDSMWPCHARLSGNLTQWMTRFQNFATLDGWQFAGQNLECEGDVRASRQRIELVNTTGKCTNFIAVGPGITIREPALEIQTTATYDVALGEFTTPATVISGSTIALRVERARVLSTPQSFAMEGDLQYRTNLERLATWFADAQQATQQRVQGEATGVVHVVHEGGETKIDATTTVEKLVVSRVAAARGLTITNVSQGPNWFTVWEEPRLEVNVQGSIDGQGTVATLKKLEVAGESLSIGATGLVRDPRGRCDLELAGQYAYDLQRLGQRLASVVGPNFQMAGTGQRPFTIRGPLFAASNPTMRPASTGASENSFAGFDQLTAQASLGWDRLQVQGIEIGKGEVETQLERGLLTMSPLNFPVSEGKIAVTPRVDLTQSPYIVTVEPGTVVDRVRITPEMCRSWLKYLAPLMADATSAEGHFSVALSDAKFPVSDPTGGNVQGKFVVHAAQIGPGPLSKELLTLVQQIRAVMDKQPLGAVAAPSAQWLDVPEQQLEFQLADHKVYHRDMQMMVKDVAIKTSGWVGVDQQIALVAEVPVLDQWVAKDRYLASLKGQTIRVPISGSLKQPRLDRSALQQLTRQTVIDAGSNLLQDELNRGLERGLNKLFQPKPPAAAPMP